MNVNSWVQRACTAGGEFDASIYIALRDRLGFCELLDILEMQDSAADHREAYRKWSKSEANNGE